MNSLSERLVDDVVLGEGIPLGQSLDLTFMAHVYGFIPLDGPLRRGERSKTQRRIHTAF